MPPTTYKPTINVPFHMTLKYVDVYPNDPAKNYGPSLALRGTIDGQDSRVYPKGFLDKNLGAMVEAGIIAPPASGDFEYDPAEKYAIPVKHAEIVVTLAQAAGEKHARTTFSTNGVAPVQSTPKPQGKQPVSLGGPLPGEYDEPNDREQPEPPFIDVRAEAAKTMLTLYRDCFSEALRMVKALNEDPKTPLEFTADNVCSICSTLFIESNRKGLTRLAA